MLFRCLIQRLGVLLAILATNRRNYPVKKIALTLVAVSALGLAACGGTPAANNTADNAADAMNVATD